MHAAIASSSITPYMWIVNGPTWKTPCEGDGIEASTPVTASYIADAAGRPGRQAGCSAEDADGDVDGAAALEQVDRVVQVDVGPCGELESVGRGVAGAD